MQVKTFSHNNTTATIYCGDSSELDITADAVCTDPPYGVSNDCDYTRFSGGLHKQRNKFQPVVGDNKPFDPSRLLKFPKVCLFGFQYFADKLPTGSVLVWQKKRPNQLGTFCSDAELAWVNSGVGVYLFQHWWNGFDRQSERGKTLHPNQKPVALWRWVFEKMELSAGQTVFDPFAGSGSCGVAALQSGLNYVGCEIVPDYYEITCKRLAEVADNTRTVVSCSGSD